mgnify:CR=1 FL=1
MFAFAETRTASPLIQMSTFRNPVLSIGFATSALVLTVILDVDRPRRGVVQVSEASLERLKAQLDAEVK